MSSSEAAPANVRVLVRVRPLNDREGQTSVLEIDNDGMTPSIDFGMNNGNKDSTNNNTSEGTVSIVEHGGYGSGYDSGANTAAALSAAAGPTKSFTYDAVFGPQSQQVEIFDSVKGIVDAVCAGYNGTIVAYGQTGSGKTHTIFGEEGLQDDSNAGLVQRSLKSIFHKIAEQSLISPTSAGSVGGGTIRTTTKASFFEIYNERVFDLLSSSDNFAEDEKGLPVREDSTKGVYIEGLAEREVCNTAEAMDVLRCGMDNRRVAATNMNRVSSRSHAMFVLTVKSELFSENGISKVRVSKFTLVDLAGSERQKATAADGERLKEASMINNSLLCLGQVINSLVDREKGKERHVPFRDSKLTFLLRDSWGGNSKTCLVATVTPSASSLSETISTLKFAQRAKLIKNTAVLNENTCGSVAALQAEITRLRSELGQRNASSITKSTGGEATANPEEAAPANAKPDVSISALRNQNSKLNKKVKILKDASNHREMQVNSLKRKLQQETLIRKCKERRINYLSSKGKTTGLDETDGNDEISTLREEISLLRSQLEAQPSESVEWMLKYKEAKAKVEEMEVDATTRFEAGEKDELQASIATLLNERDTLQQQVESMSNERNTEIDSIIKDVAKLENANVMLQSKLNKKDLAIMANEDKIQSSEAHISELEEEMRTTLELLEASQSELGAEQEKVAELQDSVDSLKVEVNDANDAIVEHQDKVAEAKDSLKKLTEEHNEATTTLNAKITKLQKELNDAMITNEPNIKKLKDASEDLQTKKALMESLEQEKAEVLKQLELSQEENSANTDSFKLQEDSLRAEIAETEATAAALLMEKAQATTNLERMTSQNSSLSQELNNLKLERDSLQQRVQALSKLHDRVANLEDEIEFMEIEKEQVEERLQLSEGDLERSTRLYEQLTKEQAEAHANDLARCDEIIKKLTEEKSTLQNEVTALTRQLSESTAASKDEIARLKGNIDELQERIQTVEADMVEAQKTAEVLQAEQLQAAADKSNALSKEFEAVKSERDEIKEASTAKIDELQEDLDENKSLLLSLSTKLNQALGDLDTKREQLERLENEKNAFEMSNDKNTAEIEQLKETEEELREQIAKSQESLQAEKAKAASLLEEATTQNGELQQNVKSLEAQVEEASKKVAESSEDTKKMVAEHKTFIAGLNAKVTDLAQELKAALDEKNELETKLKQVTDDLQTKKISLESLEHDKNELLKQLEATGGKHTDDIESFKLKEDALKADIAKSEDTIHSLRDDKAKAVEKYKKASAQRNELSEEIIAIKLERDMMKESAASVPKLQKDIARLEVEKQHVEEKLKFAEADLGVVKASNEALNTAHENDLASRDELIRSLTEKKTSLEKQLNSVSHNATESSGKVSMLQSEISYLKEELEVMTKKEENATSELEKCKINYAKSVAFVGKQEEEFKSKIATLEKDNAKADEDTKAAKVERDELKSKIAALEKENAILREQTLNPPPSSSSDPSQWEPSPVKPTEEQDTTFGADDTFDEDAFLPNDTTFNGSAFPPPSKKSDQGASNTPKSDENASPEELTPSKTPFKKRRAVFDSASKKDATTPAKRVTRSRAKRMRTPLGPVQQTPQSSRKHRSNWSLQD